jgi:hypothetical protein
VRPSLVAITSPVDQSRPRLISFRPARYVNRPSHFLQKSNKSQVFLRRRKPIPSGSQKNRIFFSSVFFNLHFFCAGFAIFDGYCGIASGIPAAIKTQTKKMTDPIVIIIGRLFSL